MHDFVLFMANTGLRPDEAWQLELRDVKIEDDYATKETILVIDVRGKVGTGYCKSMPNAVYPLKILASGAPPNSRPRQDGGGDFQALAEGEDVSAVQPRPLQRDS